MARRCGHPLFANPKMVGMPFTNIETRRIPLRGHEHVVVLGTNECRKLAIELDLRISRAKPSTAEIFEQAIGRLEAI
jgi:hypothetical protein